MPLGSRFTRYFNPTLEALRALGGSARPREVFDWIAEKLNLSEEERAIENQNGELRYENDIAWARFYLARVGYLDASKRGVWSLTERGLNSPPLNDEQISNILRNVAQAERPQKPTDEQLDVAIKKEEESVAPTDRPSGYREQVLATMQSLPSQGFERLCQRLLRESGFQQVSVTGRSRDGGIDGIGILQVNAFVSFKVLFQCKRYQGAVGSGEVRDLRGAMVGRADKALLLTTGTFTTEAQKEAIRDGAPPIELVDGQALVSLLETLELGLIPRTTFELDQKFFDEFR